jgi:hypothetical protein
MTIELQKSKEDLEIPMFIETKFILEIKKNFPSSL